MKTKQIVTTVGQLATAVSTSYAFSTVFSALTPTNPVTMVTNVVATTVFTDRVMKTHGNQAVIGFVEDVWAIFEQ